MNSTPRPFRIPASTVVFTSFGAFALTLGIIAMTADLRSVHPLLNQDGGLALVVTAIALLLSGAFPLALSLLASQSSDEKNGHE